MSDVNDLKIIPDGLWLVTTREDEKDNGCIVNTVQVASESPLCISVEIFKQTYTHGMIERTGIFNVNVLSNDTILYIFKKFGMKSGENTDKFDGYWDCSRAENGIKYLTVYANAYYTCKVTGSEDCGATTKFTAEVTEVVSLSDLPSLTFDYYDRQIKGRPERGVLKTWMCTYCQFEYKGEFLPRDIRCPMCGQGYEFFELQEEEKNPNPRQVCAICGYVHTGELTEDYVCPQCHHDAFNFNSI